MRKYSEPTSRNLLRRPLIMGVPFQGLLALSLLVLSITVIGGSSSLSNLIALVCSILGYALLRIVNRVLKPGWEESSVFWIEKRTAKSTCSEFMSSPSKIEVTAPDALTVSDQIVIKENFKEIFLGLRESETFIQSCSLTSEGAVIRTHHHDGKPSIQSFDKKITNPKYVYSLYALPVMTDPLWLSHLVHKAKPSIESKLEIIAAYKGVNQRQVKARIETARKSNSQSHRFLTNIDSLVSFDEASQVLEKISRGEEAVVELSLIIASDEALQLDESLFCREKNHELSLASALGFRPRFHRSHLVSVTTATDFIPNFFDPKEDGASLLRSPRGYPVHFNPIDQRLEALHWLVVGASGSGKSFFTGVILKRLLDAQSNLSAIFIDHNRSFKRFVTMKMSPYIEPETVGDLEHGTGDLLKTLEQPNSVAGVELSELLLEEKKAGAHILLQAIEKFLKSRKSVHPVYIVLDECWNFMRDEPVMVQRAFREFRKLNGGAIAITQSLSDFLTDQSGQSIFQNAPIRILLRQGEDIGRYQGILNLNEVETEKVKIFKQEKGKFSECLIKTPFLSRIGRLYPTEEEYQMLRTDNLREEFLRNLKLGKEAAYA